MPELFFQNSGYRASQRPLQYFERFLRGLPIILLSAFVLIEGARFFAFTALTARDGTFTGAEDNRINALTPWAKIMGVRAEALAEIISLKAAPGAQIPLDRVKPDLATLLTIRPMWGHYWMLFAEAGLVNGEQVSQALSAFEMAELTSPREARVMLERIKFGLVFWELLPQASRGRSVSNLIAIRHHLPIGEIATIKSILDVKNEGVRADIRTRLEQKVGSYAGWFGQFGL